MEDINKIIEEESFKKYPVVTNVTGGDCNKRKREEWVDACNKGIEILTKWNESRNPQKVTEWDDSHELNNVINNMVDDLDEWYQIPTNSDLYVELLQDLQSVPVFKSVININNRYSEYVFGSGIYRITWNKWSTTPTVERKINN